MHRKFRRQTSRNRSETYQRRSPLKKRAPVYLCEYFALFDLLSGSPPYFQNTNPKFWLGLAIFSNIVCRTELIKIQIHFSKMVYNRKDASLELSRGNVLPRLPPNLRTTIWTLVNGRIFRPVARFTHDQLFCLENQIKQFTPDRISLKFSRCPTITEKPCMFRLLRRWFEPH